jgi:DNA-binding transcriptional regulator YiaG
MEPDGRMRMPTDADRPLRGEQGSLAAAIHQARKRAGMSQVELAELLGIRQSSVSQWERGATEPSTHNLLDLMRRLPGLAAALSATTADRQR